MICRNNRCLFLHQLRGYSIFAVLLAAFGGSTGHHYEHGTLLRFAFVFPLSASGLSLFRLPPMAFFNLGLARKTKMETSSRRKPL
ncbi:hypothetical protein B0T18DRAFT_171970 [Schizothecium vesticola]|uniref:Uncharacterized protein n=1 Tax=Schizothecium vesticola TaxID=314040 RepID=A0AA40K1Y3_9PEZI|nr:hypothetical protein B0T18DRAFT_171970 [Schizothecium vesticola]